MSMTEIFENESMCNIILAIGEEGCLNFDELSNKTHLPYVEVWNILNRFKGARLLFEFENGFKLSSTGKEIYAKLNK